MTEEVKMKTLFEADLVIEQELVAEEFDIDLEVMFTDLYRTWWFQSGVLVLRNRSHKPGDTRPYTYRLSLLMDEAYYKEILDILPGEETEIELQISSAIADAYKIIGGLNPTVNWDATGTPVAT